LWGFPLLLGIRRIHWVFPQRFVLLGDLHAREAAGSKENQMNQ